MTSTPDSLRRRLVLRKGGEVVSPKPAPKEDQSFVGPPQITADFSCNAKAMGRGIMVADLYGYRPENAVVHSSSYSQESTVHVFTHTYRFDFDIDLALRHYIFVADVIIGDGTTTYARRANAALTYDSLDCALNASAMLFDIAESMLRSIDSGVHPIKFYQDFFSRIDDLHNARHCPLNFGNYSSVQAEVVMSERFQQAGT